jgi:streptogramin lyase
MAAGPDGNLWFTESSANQIGRMTTAGAVTEFPVPTVGSALWGICAGPDGNVWFTEFSGNRIGRITPAGVITEFPLPIAGSGPTEITAGSDGNLWFVESSANKIGRITPAGVITEFPIPTPGSGALQIAAGPDGNLWFTENLGNNIGRITTAGVITEFPIPTPASGAVGIAAGPDGNLWFTEFDANQVGRITPAGVITEFPVPTAGSTPHGITAGPDGNLWLTQPGPGVDQIARITTAGVVTEFPIPTVPSSPLDIIAGPDGNLWFPDFDNNTICRITTGPSVPSPPLAGEFPVNTVTTGPQVDAAVASAPAGDFVVVWESGPSLRGQRFDAAGAPAGTEFPIGEFGSEPAVAASTAGFVVAWNDTKNGTIQAQRYDAAGMPQGSVFPVSSSTTLAQFDPQIAMRADGDFVVVWTTGEPGDDDGLFGRRFDAAGAPLGADFEISTVTGASQEVTDVALDDSGAFVVVWEHDGFLGDLLVYGRRYDSAGAPLGEKFLLADSHGEDPSVARDAGGGFVAVWTGVDADDDGVFGRRFAPSGNPLGHEFQVNTHTPNDQNLSRVRVGDSGGFVVTWVSEAQDDPAPGNEGVFAQRYDSTGSRVGPEFRVNTYTAGGQDAPSLAVDGRDAFVVAWHSPQDGSGNGIFGRRGGYPDSRPMKVDERVSGGSSDVNGVLEPGERVTVDPAWINAGPLPQPFSGTASNLNGPGGLYALHDDTTDYGTIAPGATHDCFTATGDCLEISVSGPRPAGHWDATLDEALSLGVSKTWTLHVGDSFTDVPRTSPFYRHIEALFHNLVTAGCGGANFCPSADVTRGQMAVFLLRARYGLNFVPPPPTGTVFLDVAPSQVFAAWIELLAAEGITAGCGGGNYCPESSVTRAQMAVFLLATRFGSSHVPPPATGIFGDVPPSDPLAPWIEELYALGITAGCSGPPLLFCPNSPVTRGQMAVFLVTTFPLALYGP